MHRDVWGRDDRIVIAQQRGREGEKDCVCACACSRAPEKGAGESSSNL